MFAKNLLGVFAFALALQQQRRSLKQQLLGADGVHLAGPEPQQHIFIIRAVKRCHLLTERVILLNHGFDFHSRNINLQ
ncbi:hypothetical protein D3C78_1876240 [compost metagenome]